MSEMTEAERRTMLEGGPTRGRLRREEERALQQRVEQGRLHQQSLTSPFSANAQSQVCLPSFPDI